MFQIDEWKVSLTVPLIRKVGQRCVLKNNHPAKNFRNVVFSSGCQYGFRSSHSTGDLFKTTFDRVWHASLQYKLILRNFCQMFGLFSLFPSNKMARVVLDGKS